MSLVIDIDEDVFNTAYLPLLEDNSRTQILFGGSSSGKSNFEAHRFLLDCLKGRNILALRKLNKSIRRSLWNEFVKAIYEFELTQYFEQSLSDYTLTCKLNNKQIIMSGIDDPEKIKSITPKDGVFTDVWLEEATEFEYKDYKQLRKRLRGASKFPKRIHLTFNPILQDHWIFNEFFKGWTNTRQRQDFEFGYIMKTTYKDNKFLSPDDIYELENETDPYYRDVYTNGNWGVLGHLVFKNFKVEEIPDEDKKCFDRLKIGLDFGFTNDPTAIPVTYYHKPTKTIYVFDELYETGLTNDVIAERIHQMGISNQVITADSAENKSIAEIKRLGVPNIKPAKKGKDSIQFGIQWLKQQTIIIDAKCLNTALEFKKYHYKEDANGNPTNVPVDKDNHIIDALRYAYEDESSPSATFGFFK